MKCPYRTKVIHKPENTDGYGQNFAEDITEFMECIKSECPFYYTTMYGNMDNCSRAEKE